MPAADAFVECGAEGASATTRARAEFVMDIVEGDGKLFLFLIAKKERCGRVMREARGTDSE